MQKNIFSLFSLTRKLTAAFLMLALVPVVIVTAIAMNTMYTERMEQVEQHNTYVARLKAGEISETLMNQVQFMKTLTELDSVQSMEPERMIPLLQSAKRESATVSSMFICDLNGQEIARDAGANVNVADRDYIKAVLHEGKSFAFSDATISKATKKVMIIVAVPVKNAQGAVIGAMASTFDMNTLQKLLKDNTDLLADRQEILYVTDTKGNVMIHPEAKYTETLTSWAELAPIKAAATGNVTFMNYINADGAESFAASSPVGTLGWTLVVENSADEVMAVLYSALLQIVGIVLVLLIIICILARMMAGSFVRPMKELSEKTELMANGDLTVRLNVESQDEIGTAAEAFNRMMAEMNDVIAKISTAAQQVASGSKNIADSGNMLAQGAATQASSVEELSASIAEISAQTGNNADNAVEANALTKEANTKAVIGNERMNNMLHAMNDINESSANIAKIIKVIDEIAFQTNILALNAAVEAARAGQHGKGFAVVAEEVRNLAARSAKAAKETTAIIEKSIAKVNDGTDLARATAEALQEIQNSIDKVTNLVSEIADASQKQSSALKMLNQGVLQVSRVVQTNSATAEESASASVELSAQADLLQDAVRKFKV